MYLNLISRNSFAQQIYDDLQFVLCKNNVFHEARVARPTEHTLRREWVSCKKSTATWRGLYFLEKCQHFNVQHIVLPVLLHIVFFLKKISQRSICILFFSSSLRLCFLIDLDVVVLLLLIKRTSRQCTVNDRGVLSYILLKHANCALSFCKIIFKTKI